MSQVGVFLGSESCYVPADFGPAISDMDRKLQEAYLAAAQNVPGATRALANAVEGAAKEILGEDQHGLSELHDDEMDELLKHANALVRDALSALHATERRLKTLMQAAEAAVLTAFDRAFEPYCEASLEPIAAGNRQQAAVRAAAEAAAAAGTAAAAAVAAQELYIESKPKVVPFIIN